MGCPFSSPSENKQSSQKQNKGEFRPKRHIIRKNKNKKKIQSLEKKVDKMTEELQQIRISINQKQNCLQLKPFNQYLRKHNHNNVRYISKTNQLIHAATPIEDVDDFLTYNWLHLKTLSMWKGGLNNQSFQKILKSSHLFPNLEKLFVPFNRISSVREGLQGFCSLKKVWFSLSGTNGPSDEENILDSESQKYLQNFSAEYPHIKVVFWQVKMEEE